MLVNDLLDSFASLPAEVRVQIWHDLCLSEPWQPIYPGDVSLDKFAILYTCHENVAKLY